MPSVPLHSGSTRTSAPEASASWQFAAGSKAIPAPWHAAAIRMSKLPVARRGSIVTVLVSPFSAVRCQMPPPCCFLVEDGEVGKLRRRHRFTRLRQERRTCDKDASADADPLHLQVGVGVEAFANPDRHIDPFMNEIDPPIGDDTLEPQQRMGGKETRQGGSNRALKSERTAQSNEPARLSLHSKRGLLGSFSLDDRRTRMFEDLLADLGQTKSSRRSIEQPYSEPLLQQSDAPTDSRFGQPERAGGGRKPAMDNDGRKELEIVEVAASLSVELSVILTRSRQMRACNCNAMRLRFRLGVPGRPRGIREHNAVADSAVGHLSSSSAGEDNLRRFNSRSYRLGSGRATTSGIFGAMEAPW